MKTIENNISLIFYTDRIKDGKTLTILEKHRIKCKLKKD